MNFRPILSPIAFLFIFCITGFPAFISAQVIHNPSFDFLDIKDGLSHASVYCIAQDKHEYMWFGTENGLNRYDGHSNKVYSVNYRDSLSLSHNHIRCLFTDSKNQLWIGTLGGGLNQYAYNSDNFVHFFHQPSNRNSLSDNEVYTITEDDKGNIWIGTENGLNKLNPINKQIERFYKTDAIENKLSTNAILALHFDSSQNLWIGGWNGNLQQYNPESKDFTTIKLDGKLPTLNIWTITELSNKVLAIGTYGQGLYLYDPITGNIAHYTYHPTYSIGLTNNVVRAIEETDSLVIMAGTEFGITMIDLKDQSVAKYFEDKGRALNVWDIYTSRSGMIWVANLINGVAKTDLSQKVFGKINTQSHPILTENNILSFTEDFFGNIWIGTGNGLNKLTDSLTLSVVQLNPYQSTGYDFTIIQALTTDRNGHIWAGTYYGKGIFIIDPEKNKIIRKLNLPIENITKLYQDKWGIMWIGATNSLSYLDPITNQLKTFTHNPSDNTSFSKGAVQCFFERADGTLWIGTDGGGLNRFDRNLSKFERFSYSFENKSSLSSNTVYCINEDNAGNLWVGTSSGLNLFNDQNNGFTIYGKEKNMPSEAIYGLIIDENGLFWISSNRGIFKYNVNTLNAFQYGLDDGLQGLSFNPNVQLKTTSGRYFFGGSRGLNYFNPQEIKTNPYVPMPVLTNLLFNNKPITHENSDVLNKQISESHSIRIPANQRAFTIEYICPSYINAEKYQYAYMLEGFDTDYVYVGNRKNATYTNLQPGHYVFKIKAANNDMVWNQHPRELKIYIVPPIYKTIWFRIMVILIVCIIIAAYTIYRRKAILHQKLKLEKLVEVKTQKLNLANQELKTKTKDLEKTSLTLSRVNELLFAQKNEIAEKANEIKRLNDELINDNKQLLTDKSQLLTEKILQKRFSYTEFKLVFKDDEACYKFLDDLKWGHSFSCHKCGNTTFKYLVSDQHLPYSRRCASCQHIESPMVNTIFNHIKFPIHKAFYIFFITLNGKQQSLDSLSAEISLRKQTCWSFQKKVRDAIMKIKRSKKCETKLERIMIL